MLQSSYSHAFTMLQACYPNAQPYCHHLVTMSNAILQPFTIMQSRTHMSVCTVLIHDAQLRMRGCTMPILASSTSNASPSPCYYSYPYAYSYPYTDPYPHPLVPRVRSCLPPRIPQKSRKGVLQCTEPMKRSHEGWNGRLGVFRVLPHNDMRDGMRHEMERPRIPCHPSYRL